MTISEVREKCKSVFSNVPKDVIIVSVLILASLASFGLGYITGFDGGLSDKPKQGSAFMSFNPSTKTPVLASKNGTRYYLSSCTGAKRISKANKIWFISAEVAKVAGYAPASNCLFK